MVIFLIQVLILYIVFILIKCFAVHTIWDTLRGQ